MIKEMLNNLPGRGQAVAKSLNRGKVTPGGNIPIYNQPGALTRDQRAGNIYGGGTKAANRMEELASVATGRGSIRQKYAAKKPTVGQDQFIDSEGGVRQKMSVGNWRNQAQGQMGQYRGFSYEGNEIVSFSVAENLAVYGMPLVSF